MEGADKEIDEAEKFRRKRPSCLCKLQDKKKVWWDLLIMFLATWNCFSIPFDVAFANDFDTPVFMEITNSMIDFLFIADVVVAFRSTY